MNESKTITGSQPGNTNHQPPSKNIVDTVIAAGNLTTLAAAIKTARVSDVLSAKGPFTMFAPTDKAFEKLPRGALDALLKDAKKLKAVLDYHLIAGHFLAQELKSGEVMTVQGTALAASVSPSGVQVNEARIEQADIVATNGVVHVIDTVVLPKNWQLLAAAA